MRKRATSHLSSFSGDESVDDNTSQPASPLPALPFACFSSPPFILPGVSLLRSPSDSIASRISTAQRALRPMRSGLTSNHKKVDTADSSKRLRRSESSTSNYNTSNDVALTTADGEDAWICAVVESRGATHEIGIATLETGTGRCLLGQFTDTQTYAHLVVLLDTHPTALVLLSGPAQEASAFRIPDARADPLDLLFEELDIRTIKCPRKNFNEQNGSDCIELLLRRNADETSSLDRKQSIGRPGEICDSSTSSAIMKSAISKKYFALSAASALFRYLEGDRRGCLKPGSLSLSYYTPKGTIVVDNKTSTNLDLIRDRITRKATGSLFGMVNHCSTPMGERLLRMNVSQPLANQADLNDRYDAVEELVQQSDRFLSLKESLKGAMKKRVDMDKLITQLRSDSLARRTGDSSKVESTLAQLISMRQILASIARLRASLDGAESHLLRTAASVLDVDKVHYLLTSIDACIHADLLQGHAKASLTSRNARLYAVRAGRDSILDAARQTYQENSGDALECCQRYVEQHNLPFKIIFSTQSSSGYSLELPAGTVRSQDLPSQFVNVSTKRGGKTLTMTTIELKKCNQRMNDSIQEIFLLSESVVESLRQQVLEDVGMLYKISEVLAILDVIASLAHCALAGRYVRPSFGTKLNIEKGRHPILDLRNSQKTVPNDIQLGGAVTFRCLSGPNSSGKTTFLKQVALLTIMAHIGSFVPAEAACFPPCDRIMSRLSNEDEPESNLSTFAQEMKTISYILYTATASSIVLIDELGRATSTHEGFAIAHAVSETLIERKVSTIFATHCLHLATTLAPYPNFACNRLLVSLNRGTDGRRSFSFAHRIAPGVSDEVNYGLVLASDCNLPPTLLQDATQMANTMQERRNLAHARSNGIMAAKRREAVMELQQNLQQIFNSRKHLSDISVLQKLAWLQDDFIRSIDRHLPRASEYAADHDNDGITADVVMQSID